MACVLKWPIVFGCTGAARDIGIEAGWAVRAVVDPNRRLRSNLTRRQLGKHAAASARNAIKNVARHGERGEGVEVWNGGKDACEGVVVQIQCRQRRELADPNGNGAIDGATFKHERLERGQCFDRVRHRANDHKVTSNGERLQCSQIANAVRQRPDGVVVWNHQRDDISIRIARDTVAIFIMPLAKVTAPGVPIVRDPPILAVRQCSVKIFQRSQLRRVCWRRRRRENRIEKEEKHIIFFTAIMT